jgi:hypothetical protein
MRHPQAREALPAYPIPGRRATPFCQADELFYGGQAGGRRPRPASRPWRIGRGAFAHLPQLSQLAP